jgi:hypothetical protein
VVALRKNVIDIVKKIARGFIFGLLYYLIYITAIPMLFSRALQIPTEMVTGVVVMSYIWFFIALETFISLIHKHIISMPMKVLSKMLYALMLYSVFNRGILSIEIPYNSHIISATVNVSVILYIIILASIIYGFLDAFSLFSK